MKISSLNLCRKNSNNYDVYNIIYKNYYEYDYYVNVLIASDDKSE